MLKRKNQHIEFRNKLYEDKTFMTKSHTKNIELLLELILGTQLDCFEKTPSERDEFLRYRYPVLIETSDKLQAEILELRNKHLTSKENLEKIAEIHFRIRIILKTIRRLDHGLQITEIRTMLNNLVT